MTKIAFDVALLPPEKVMDAAITLNQKYGPMFNLNKKDRLPHITLSQAVMDKTDLDKAIPKLGEIAGRFHPLRLKAEIVNEPATFLRVVMTKPLKELHEAVMDELEELVSYDVKAEFFLDDAVRESSINYVHNFRTDAAFESFDPHISIAVEQQIDDKHTQSFTTDHLVLCHLGNYNTCRKILWETRLK